jgi:hypothetical protein
MAVMGFFLAWFAVVTARAGRSLEPFEGPSPAAVLNRANAEEKLLTRQRRFQSAAEGRRARHVAPLPDLLGFQINRALARRQ